MQISGFVYIIIGGIVAFFSNLVYTKSGTGSILIFFYVGLAFIVVGVFKLLKRYIFGRKKSDDGTNSVFSQKRAKERNDILTKLINKDLASVDTERRNPPHMGQQQILACPQCGTRHYNTSNFCHKCGTRLR